MILQMYVFWIIIALLSLIMTFLSNVNSSIKSIFSVISMGLFAYLAISSYNVTSVYMIGTTKYHEILFQDSEGIAASWMMMMFFFISFILLVVNVFMTFNEINEPKWKGKLREAREDR